MQFAIIKGLYGIDTPATFSCPSSCRWDGSLGFKSACKNVTQNRLRSAACDGTETRNQCNMTTPNGVNIITHRIHTDAATSYVMNTTSTLEPSVEEKLLEIARFGIYWSSPDGNFRLQNVSITQCSLYLTVYEYTNAFINGSLFYFLETREVGYPIGDRKMVFRTNETKTEDNHTSPALQIGEWDLQALHNFFESATISTEWIEGNWQNPNPGHSAALKGDVGIPARFDHMAASMAEYLRNGPNKLLAEGVKVDSVVYVSIWWISFVVPILTEVLALLFAVLTVLRNRRSRIVPPWKSSTLAVLACRIEERSGVLKGDPDGKDVDELLQAANKTEVQLH